MRYILVEWPDIQDYMDNPDYPEKCYFDPNKNVWFVPETWDDLKLGGDIGNLDLRSFQELLSK